MEDALRLGKLTAREQIDAAQLEVGRLEQQLMDLPKTIKTIERQLLQARLSSSSKGQRAMEVVGNAIEALQSGNLTKLLP